MTYWISLPGITFSLEARDGAIIDASSVARWTIGLDTVIALDYYRRQGAAIDWIAHDH